MRPMSSRSIALWRRARSAAGSHPTVPVRADRMRGVRGGGECGMSEHEAPRAARPEFPEFDRRFFESREDFTLIGSGALGGKAQGLARIKRMLDEEWRPGEHPDCEGNIPRLAVLATDSFDRFIDEKGLWGGA